MSRDELYGGLGFNEFSSKSFLTETLPRLNVNAGARVLDLGCGTGPGSCFLAALGYRVHGIDVIPDAIDKAREIAAERGLDIKYDVMDVCHLPHEGKPYELIIDGYCSQGIVTDKDRAAMFSGVKARLASHGYLLMSCSVFEQHRETPETQVVDEATGKVFTAFDGNDLWDGDTETCYNRFYVDPLRPGAGPEDFDGTILVNGVWFIHRRRYRTPENLRTELKSHGFTVLEQSGEVMENAICTHQGYGEPQSLDHEMGEIRCIQANTAGSEQSTKCSSAGVR
ncbi:MAG: class I SAM-dependent methyltransferase [Caldilineaceae bacterium SB0661_bin_34]|nr:class I SAM-dependent methyltransferase [Caldilineaceae bacterium SB0661_bin_34]